MKAKAVIPREQASRDVDEAIAYYLNEATEAVALGFIDALVGNRGLTPLQVLLGALFCWGSLNVIIR